MHYAYLDCCETTKNRKKTQKFIAIKTDLSAKNGFIQVHIVYKCGLFNQPVKVIVHKFTFSLQFLFIFFAASIWFFHSPVAKFLNHNIALFVVKNANEIRFMVVISLFENILVALCAVMIVRMSQFIKFHGQYFVLFLLMVSNWMTLTWNMLFRIVCFVELPEIFSVHSIVMRPIFFFNFWK